MFSAITFDKKWLLDTQQELALYMESMQNKTLYSDKKIEDYQQTQALISSIQTKCNKKINTYTDFKPETKHQNWTDIVQKHVNLNSYTYDELKPLATVLRLIPAY